MEDITIFELGVKLMTIRQPLNRYFTVQHLNLKMFLKKNVVPTEYIYVTNACAWDNILTDKGKSSSFSLVKIVKMCEQNPPINSCLIFSNHGSVDRFTTSICDKKAISQELCQSY